MTKIRRAAQVVEDLKTLGVITADQVSLRLSLNGGIMVVIDVPKSHHNDYYLVKYAFEQEFTNDVAIIEDSEAIQFITSN